MYKLPIFIYIYIILPFASQRIGSQGAGCRKASPLRSADPRWDPGRERCSWWILGIMLSDSVGIMNWSKKHGETPYEPVESNGPEGIQMYTVSHDIPISRSHIPLIFHDPVIIPLGSLDLETMDLMAMARPGALGQKASQQREPTTGGSYMASPDQLIWWPFGPPFKFLLISELTHLTLEACIVKTSNLQLSLSYPACWSCLEIGRWMSHGTGCLPCQEGSGRLRSLHQHAHDWLGNRWSGLAYLGSGWSALRPLLLLLGHSTLLQENIVCRSGNSWNLICFGLFPTMIWMFFRLAIALLLLFVLLARLKATVLNDPKSQTISERWLGLIGFPQRFSTHTVAACSVQGYELVRRIYHMGPEVFCALCSEHRMDLSLEAKIWLQGMQICVEYCRTMSN